MAKNTPAISHRTGPKPAGEAWMGAKWQAEARRELARATARLASPGGELGRSYLVSRGFVPETWQAWGLGYGTPRHPILAVDKPAIIIPWQRAGIVKALQYRFFGADIDDCADAGDRKRRRFGARKGSVRTILGPDLLGKHRQTLFLVEGDLNAPSIWQALREGCYVNWDVSSFGAEDAAISAAVCGLAKHYNQVIVWCDKPGKAANAMKTIPGVHGMCSPQREGKKLDANELLQIGRLADFLRGVWARFDQADGAKVQAELESLELMQMSN